MSEQYHEVFVPAPDVFHLGGPEVFTRLVGVDDKTNLVIVPDTFVRRLVEASETSNYLGARGTLDHLKKVTTGERKKHTGEADLAIFNVAPGLDIASVGLADNGDEATTLKLLEELVEREIPAERKRPVLLTTRSELHFSLARRGMLVEDPKFLMVGPDVIHEGVVRSNETLTSLLYERNHMPVEEAEEVLDRDLYTHQFIDLGNGSYARVTGELKRNRSGTRIIEVEDERVELLPNNGRKIHLGQRRLDNVLGVRPLDDRQHLALQYGLFNPEVDLIFLCGGAGSGKTILSYVAGLDQVLWYNRDERQARGWGEKGGLFDRIVLLKPFEILGGKRRDVGALPGGLFDKIKFQLESYTDAHRLTSLQGTWSFEDMFLHPKHPNDFGKVRQGGNDKKVNGAHLNPHSEVVELTYSGFLRGRSFHNTFVIIDEAQNFTPYEMKTILSRMGDGCKAVVLGDPYEQIDNPHCTPEINGITHAVSQFLSRPYSSLVPLTTLHRSQVAEDATNWQGVYR